ncbi:hypothetical protein OBBRIDRAFT_17758 [Obba rivulosa]|uniref:Uncharacterized protein n=1 Tax=Obba rivulosa TaxID=1052685 RepID=A0A8E2DW31_9APHY|nr:hypothetical protein OBBRIDRAFT_17758 [Obba rivulosa]
MAQYTRFGLIPFAYVCSIPEDSPLLILRCSSRKTRVRPSGVGWSVYRKSVDWVLTVTTSVFVVTRLLGELHMWSRTRLMTPLRAYHTPL